MKIEAILKEIERLGETGHVHEVEKNGVKCVCIYLSSDNAVKPVVYLNGFPEECSAEEIAKKIIEISKEHENPCIDFSFVNEWHKVKPMVIPCIARKAGKDAVKMPFLDMELYFRAVINNCMSMIIRKDMLNLYNISFDELYTTAFENYKDEREVFGFGHMTVITNEKRHHGAAHICDKELLAELADKMQSDLVILPSSIHECLIFEYDGSDLSEFNEMVRNVNADTVDPEEQLSDHAYIYKRESREITY